jgi:protein TonB
VKVVKAPNVINGLATFLPKPSYPAMAKQIRLQGSVNVQVLIDETGKVVSAKAVSGHPLLIAECLKAATNARFTPTTLNGVPVKLSGVIVYNFVMQ